MLSIHKSISNKKIILGILSFILLTFSLLILVKISYDNQSVILENRNNFPDFYFVNAPNLIISQVYEINDDYIGDSIGDDDSLIDAGETIELRLELTNNGDQAVTNVYGNLTTTNSHVTLSNYNQSYLQINPGEFGVSTSYYLLEFDSKFNVSDIVTFSLEITATEGTWFDTFQLTIMGVPDPGYFGHEVTNESNGDLNADDDSIVDPGEIIQMKFYIENQGTSIFFDAEGYIATADPFITVTDDYGYFGSIVGDGDFDYGYFGFTVSGACPDQHALTFNLSLADSFGNWWNSSFDFVISGYPEYSLENITFIEYYGDADAFMDAGEQWYAIMEIKNIGDALGANTRIGLNSDDPFVSFYYDERNISYSDLYAGFSSEQSGYYDWRFTISDRVLENQILDFYFAIYDDTSPSISIINTTAQVVGIANYELLNFSIIEYYESERDGIIAAGENFVANISFINTGAAIGKNIEIFLYSSEKHVEFYYENGSSEYLSSLDVGESTSIISYYSWDFILSERAKAGQEINFTIVITDGSLREWFFDVSFVVDDGPNTFIHTPTGKAWVIGGTLAFIIFCIFPFVRKQMKSKGKITGGFREWQVNQKEKIKIKREERKKFREQKQQEREALRQQRERDRIARINANEKKLLEKFEDILEMSESVEISKVAKSLALTETQLFEKLIQWQDILPFKIDGEYIEVDDTGDFAQSIRQKIAEMTKYYSCYHCGFPIERTAETCPDCKQTIDRCAVCKLPISFGESFSICSKCETKGHDTHLQEWVKTQGKCPHCLQKVSLKDIKLQESDYAKKKGN
jgi:hypothetical protein